MFGKLSHNWLIRLLAQSYIDLLQSTLLMQLFIWFFLLSLYGIELPATFAAGAALTMNATAFFAENLAWLHRGDPSDAMGSRSVYRYVPHGTGIIAPQAVRIALAPTVGFR
jgi:polar amino acid transport system permease protein